MNQFRAGHLPGLDPQALDWIDLGPRIPACAGISVPRLNPEQIRSVMRTVQVQAQTHIRAMPVSDIIERIDAAIHRLLDPGDAARQQLDQWLPRVCSLDPELLRLQMNQYLKTFRAQELHRFVAQDLPNPKALDSFQPLVKGGCGLALGPDLLLHLWAGNVAGLSLWSLVCGLLVKAGNVGKLASTEPVVATIFVQLLIEIEPRWRQALALLWWQGGDTELQNAACAQAQCIAGYGSDSTLQSLRHGLPAGVKFLEHGHKLGFGVIAATALNARHGPDLALAAAHDVARHDQGGCYSPHVFYVERGARIPPQEWAQRLFHALQNLHQRHPRQHPDPEQALAYSLWRQKQEWTTGIQFQHGSGGDVAYLDQATPLAPGPGLRCVQVVAVDHLSQVPDCIAVARPWLQTAGLALTPQQWPGFARQLGQVGVSRLCAIGAMTAPEAGWHHDGGHSLGDYLRWVEVDQSLIIAAERHAPYAD